MQATTANVVTFLSSLYESGLSYSSLNVARSALASFVVLSDSAHTIGTHPLIARFLKGVFGERPPKPRYETIWDVKIVLNFLRKWSPRSRLSMKQLTLKLVMLIALVSAQRSQTIHKLCLDNLTFSGSNANFKITDTLKHSRPGLPGMIVTLEAYPVDTRLCVLTYLKYYISETKKFREQNGVVENRLFISYKKPYKAVTQDTISRWIHIVMKLSGVDVSYFKPHSTRAASASAAEKLGVPIAEILKTAGWSNERTFMKFYNKPLVAKRCMTQNLLKK